MESILAKICRATSYVYACIYLLGNHLYYCLITMMFVSDFSVVAASIVVFTIGSEGQVFATSAIRYCTI